MKQSFLLFLFFLSVSLQAQELYPNGEPASTTPKGVFGLRLMNESYSGGIYTRNWFGIRCIYGLKPKWTLMATLNLSNHHPDTLPRAYYSLDNSTAGPHSHAFIKGGFPYLFGGVTLYSKYRFLTLDGDETHFRMAMYNSLALAHVAHDESKPELMGDNAGTENGVMATYLLNKFAATISGGLLIPFTYHESVTLNHVLVDNTYQNNVNEKRTFRSGNSLMYSLSLGYEVWPFKYGTNYKRPAVNIYLEFIGQSYDSATLKLNGHRVIVGRGQETRSLQNGHVIDMRPGIQLILASNTRIEFSPSFVVSGVDYTLPVTYINGNHALNRLPVFYINLQRYFFKNEKHIKNK